MDNNYSTEGLNTVERIQLAVDESRKQQEQINRLIEETRNETRPVIIEENQREIERLLQEHKEYDEMTVNGYNRYYNNLNNIVSRLTIENATNPLNEAKQKMLDNAMKQRNGLLEIARNNNDILPYVGKDKKENNDETKPGDKEKIEEEIEKYKKHSNELIETINKIKATLVLGIGTESLNINNEIIELGKELKELDNEAHELISDIDEFNKNAFGETPSMTVAEIKKTLKILKDRLKDLKKHQIDKYNSRVSAMNAKIDELKALADVPENIANMIGQLNKMDLCNVKISNYKDVNYLNQINYNKLVEMYNLISQIEKELGKEQQPEKVDLTSDIRHIEEEIARVEYYIADTMTKEAIDSLNEDIAMISDNINEFRAKLENNKDKLSLDDYRVYLEIIEEDERKLDELKDKLSKVKDVDKENGLYQEFLTRLNNLSRYVNSLEILVEALKGNVYENTIDVFKSKLNGAARSLSQIKAEIEQAKSEGKLDDVQYNNLNAKMNEIEEVINRSSDKLLDPEMVMGGDTFTLINGNIDRLEEEIEKLENHINTLDQPIKDRKRKDIDKTIANLEREIKVIRSILKKHKDEDEEKYRASVERLNGLEERLSKISKNYRSKCPLRVKSVKSAKAFYKKHKKPILIAAGIAALAVELTVGPVIMPAIMKGNLMIMNKLPFTRPLFKSLNKVLASCIGASEVTFKGAKVWKLANGTIINPTCASVSLLKGVALASGTSTLVPLVAGAVAGIKALNEKMKKSKLKEKIINTPNNVKLNDDNLNILYNEYKKFGGTAEEFAEFYGLDQRFIEMLNKLDNERSNGERQPEETNNNGRSR